MSLQYCNRYKDYVGVTLGPNFVSPEWMCPLNRGDPKEGFHCIRNNQGFGKCYQPTATLIVLDNTKNDPQTIIVIVYYQVCTLTTIITYGRRQLT